jgi:hypothetical protein
MNINLTKHKRETTFGNVKADVLADKDPHFTRGNFCSAIRRSAWRVNLSASSKRKFKRLGFREASVGQDRPAATRRLEHSGTHHVQKSGAHHGADEIN